jgi:hypothetical protein
VWVEHAKGKESQPFVVESLLVDTRRSAHKNLSHLGDSFLQNFCRVLLQLLFDKLSDCRAIQISIPVGAQSSAGRKGDRGAKVPVFGFNPTVFCPLTIVPLKRVLGVPLANEMSELKAQPQRVNNQ